MSGCTKVTDEAFEHLKGIKKLIMSDCTKVTGSGIIDLKGDIHLSL